MARQIRIDQIPDVMEDAIVFLVAATKVSTASPITCGICKIDICLAMFTLR